MRHSGEASVQEAWVLMRVIVLRRYFNFANSCVPVSAFLILGIAAALCACSTKPKGPQGPPPAAHVKVEVINPQPVTDSSEYVATLKSRQSATISPQVEGSITDIFVHSGEHV